MFETPHLRLAAAVTALGLLAAACGSDDKSASTAATTSTAAATVTTAAATSAPTSGSGSATGGGAGLSGLLWDKGKCDSSKEVYKIGSGAPGENAVLTLIDQLWAVEAAVAAFNARGGIGGHCMKAVTCASDPNPNSETQCARTLVDQGVVVTVNDTTPFSGPGFDGVLQAAKISRFQDSPTSSAELASPIVYPIGAGGAGTTFLMAPPCFSVGKKKIAAIHVDTPTIGATLDAMETIIKAHGGELVARIPVPAGTTDYQQFILTAQNKGADCAVLPLGGQEASQVILAAKALGSSMYFSSSWGTFPLADIQALGDFGQQILFNAELPPATASQQRWPILKDLLADLGASTHPELKPNKLKSSPARSWVAIYSLVKVIEKFGTPDVVTKDAVTAAIKAAKNVDMLGLTPAWTPTAFVAPGSPFAAISQPWYYSGGYDNKTKAFTVEDKYLNVMAELGGKIDYPQP
jgi:ABC-type branched-subunit amino acid transport system substrate-binding protein